jgi:hypothetical protein
MEVRKAKCDGDKLLMPAPNAIRFKICQKATHSIGVNTLYAVARLENNAV